MLSLLGRKSVDDMYQAQESSRFGLNRGYGAAKVLPDSRNRKGEQNRIDGAED